jgi:chemotaxis protein CheZ
MTTTESIRAQYGPLITKLTLAFAAEDELVVGATLDDIVRLREKNLFADLRKLTSGLQGALERFQFDSRLVDLAEKKMPDARSRLEHVLKLTEAAANRTLDLVEDSGPIAKRTATAAHELLEMRQRFRAGGVTPPEVNIMLERVDVLLTTTLADNESMRNNLAEMVVAQGYQDLTGQIIRGVMRLVAELEVTLGELVSLSAAYGNTPGIAPPRELAEKREHGYGPMVPGVDHGVAANDQKDVDSLFKGLGL